MDNQPSPVLPIPPKKKHWVRTTIIVLVCVVVVFLVVITNIPRILNVFNHDIPPIDDSDLALQKIDLPDSVNGYSDITNAISVMYAPSEMTTVIGDLYSGKNWNDAAAKELISKNAQALAYFHQGANKPQFQWPVTADPANMSFDLLMTPLNDWRKISEINTIYAISLAKQGKDAAALDAALDSVRFGQNIEDSQDALIGYLVGISVKGMGMTAIRNAMNSSKLTPAELQPYISEMSRYMNNDAGLISAFKAEYHMQVSMINPEKLKAMLLVLVDPKDLNTPQENLHGMTPNEYASKATDSFYFQPNKTRLLFADNTRDVIKNIPTSCGVTPEAPLKLLAPRNFFSMYVEPNYIGEVLHDIIALGLNGADRVKCQDRALVGETQILLALRAYKTATKSLPSSLDQLVPTYLQAIPTDPFNRQPLQYSLQNKTIFSSYATSTITIGF